MSSIQGVNSALNSPASSANTTTSTSSSTNSGTSGITQLASNQFLTLLLTELQNQDPLNPLDGNQFTTQLAQLTELSSIQQLSQNSAEQLKIQELTQGAALIGKNITFSQTGSNTPGQGTVSSVQVNNGQVQLLVGGTPVGIDQVLSVTP